MFARVCVLIRFMGERYKHAHDLEKGDVLVKFPFDARVCFEGLKGKRLTECWRYHFIQLNDTLEVSRDNLQGK